MKLIVIIEIQALLIARNCLFSAVQNGQIESSIYLLKDLQNCSKEVQEINMEAMINMPYSENLEIVFIRTSDLVLELMELHKVMFVKNVKSYFRMIAIVMKAKGSCNWFQPHTKCIRLFVFLVQ